MGPRAVTCSGSFLALYLVGWWTLDVPIQRGPSALVFYLGFLISIIVGFMVADMLPAKSSLPPPDKDGPPYLSVTGVQPSDKAKMREAVMAGVLEAIKGLVQRSEAAEKRLKELEGRVSEVSLAAGLKPRVTRAPGAERPT